VRVALVAVLAAGCGRFDFDPQTTSDAMRASDAADAADEAVPLTCTTEPFDTPDVQWMFWSNMSGFAAIFNGGQLQFSIPANMNGYAGIDLQPGRDFTGGRLTIEAPQVAASNNAEMYMMVVAPGGDHYVVLYSETGLSAQVVRNATADAVNSDPYNAVDHRWWRIEHLPASNTVEVSTSSDAVTWKVQLSAAATIPVNDVTIQLATGTYLGGSASPGVPAFDNFTYCLP
jgi:hypothetical protein